MDNLNKVTHPIPETKEHRAYLPGEYIENYVSDETVQSYVKKGWCSVTFRTPASKDPAVLKKLANEKAAAEKEKEKKRAAQEKKKADKEASKDKAEKAAE